MKTLSTAALVVALAIPISPALPLTGCTSSLNRTGALTPANITEAQNIVAGLSRAYADVKADFPALIPAGTATDSKIAAALGGAAAAVSDLSTIASAGGNATALQTASTAAADVLNILAAVLPASGLPPELLLGLQAAQLLLPDLTALAGNLVPPTAAPMAAMAKLPMRFNNPGLTKDAALSVLAAR